MDTEDIFVLIGSAVVVIGMGIGWRALRRWAARDRARRALPFGVDVTVAEGSRCGLCRAALTSSATRVAGLDLCPACLRGDLRERLFGSGIRIQDVSLWYYPREGTIGGQSRSLRGSIGSSTGIQAKFARQGDWLMLSDADGREWKSGDPEFDGAVAVRTNDGESLAAALQSASIRSAIGEALRFEASGLTLSDSTLQLDVSGRVEKELDHLRCCMAIVLGQLAQGAGSGYRGSPIEQTNRRPYPDLSYVLDQGPSTVRNAFISFSSLDDLHDVQRLFESQAGSDKPVEGLHLKAVYLGGAITALTKMRTLRVLVMDDVTGVQDWTPMASLSSLEALTLARCPLSDVSPLAGLKSLRTLSLEQSPVSDLTPLAGLTSLQELNIRATAVSDLTPLGALSGLRQIRLFGAPVSSQQVDWLRKALPDLEVAEY